MAAGQRMDLSSLRQLVNDDTSPEFVRRLNAVYWDARRMNENFAQYGGKLRNFDREFCDTIAKNFHSKSFIEQASDLNCHVFDVISAYCDFIIQAPACDFTFDLYIVEAVRQQYVKLDDVMDFVILLMQNEQISVVDLFLKEFWSPCQILIFCTLIHSAIFNYDLIKELDSKWDDIVFEKVEKPLWSDTIRNISKTMRRNPYKVHVPENVSAIEHRVDNQIIPSCTELREFVNLNKDAFDTIAKDFLTEINSIEIGVPEFEKIPDLALVGDRRFENMELFKKKFCAYQLCDHLEIGFEKRMNLNKNDKLIVEFEQQFLPASYISWNREEGDTKISLYVKRNGRKIMRQVEANKVAMFMNPAVMCGAGTRVLAELHKNYGESGQKISSWQWATLGSFPIKEFKFHYLVFFDNGAVRFVRPPSIRLCIVQPRDPNEDKFNPTFAYKCVKGVRRDFIRDYFKLYPSNPLMNINIEENAANLTVIRELSKKKKKPEKAAVLRKSYEGCLLLVRYYSNDEFGTCRELECADHQHNDEWIFAGDYQRIPVLKNIIDVKLTSNDDSLDINSYPENIRPYIRMLYPKYEHESKEFDDLLLEQFKFKNTARKTIGNRKENACLDFFNNARNMRLRFNQILNPKLKVKKRRIREKLIEEWLEFPNWDELTKVAHQNCGPKCLINIKGCHLLSQSKYKNCSPLFRPFLFGFSRNLVAYVSGKSLDDLEDKELIDDICYYYIAPCGRTLRNEIEVAYYLHITKCDHVAVDQFTFRSWERVNFVLKSDERALILQDYSCSREAVDIPVVNSVDTEGIPNMIYQHLRSMDTPILEKQMEFVSCCSCTDDCLDAENCDCQKLTAETHQRLDEQIRQDAADGYVLRRLESKLFTGIYECNSLCACRQNCVNRVVQKDMVVPLQLFKTENKGWGVRTLVDLPAGQFISTYSGKMYTDVKADEYVRSGKGNDMYFADVDLYDSVENMKCGINLPLDDEGIDVGGEKKTKKSKKRRSKKWSHKKKATTNKDEEEDEPVLTSILRRVFDEESLFVVDAQDRGNIGRFFNHSCDPNLEVQMVFHETHDLRLPLIAFFTCVDIEAGTELCWNYGYVAGSVSGKSINCNCGAAICVGRIL